MNRDFNIEPACIADLQSLTHLVNSAYRGESSKAGWTTEADLLDGIRIDKEGMRSLFNQPGSVVLKYVAGGKIHGCVHLQKNNSTLYLGMLTVSPQLQGSGVGKHLLHASERHAEQLQCSSIMMTVISVRSELIAWYERHGYKNTGERKPFPADPRFGIPKQPLEFVVLQKSIR